MTTPDPRHGDIDDLEVLMLITTTDLVAPSGRRQPRRTSFTWRTLDPDVVQVRLDTRRREHPEQVWLLSRGLLAEGLTHGAGQGAIPTGPDLPDPGPIWVQLPPQVGHLRVGARELGELLRDTFSRARSAGNGCGYRCTPSSPRCRGHHKPHQPSAAGH
jgi:hypothetical protein